MSINDRDVYYKIQQLKSEGKTKELQKVLNARNKRWEREFERERKIDERKIEKEIKQEQLDKNRLRKLSEAKNKAFARTSGKILSKLLSGKKSSPPKFSTGNRFVRPKQEIRRVSNGFFR